MRNKVCWVRVIGRGAPGQGCWKEDLSHGSQPVHFCSLTYVAAIQLGVIVSPIAYSGCKFKAEITLDQLPCTIPGDRKSVV